jgi:predicted porin
MQKKIIALAIAGLVSGGAFAQSNVTVSGNIGASFNQYSLSGATAARTTYRQNTVADESSAIILSGTEKLGNGMDLWFQIDSRLTMDRGNGGVNNYSNPYTTSGLGNGNTAVGFKGNFGTFGIGRWDVHYDALAPVESYTAGALAARVGYFGIMAQVNGSQIALGSRAANAMFYVSPDFNGLKATLAYSTAPAGGEGEANIAAANGDPGNGNAYQIKLNYANGPWAAVYSYFNYKVEDRNNYTAGWAANATAVLLNTQTATAAPNPADQKSNRLGVAYTFPMGLKVGLAWDRSTISNNATGDRTRTAWMLPIKYSMGAHDFQATYASAGNTSNVAGDTGAKEWVLAYGYNLSKRTAVGVQYVNVTNKDAAGYSMHGASQAVTGLTTPTAGEDSKLLTFNVRHFF